MRSYETILAEVDVEDVMSTHVTPKAAYYVYQQGKCIGTMDSVIEAQRAFGKDVLIEKFCINSGEVDESMGKRAAVQDEADLRWMQELRKEYSGLDDLMFNVCYDEASERGHSSGWDNVADCMFEVVGFATKVINLSRGV